MSRGKSDLDALTPTIPNYKTGFHNLSQCLWLEFQQISLCHNKSALTWRQLLLAACNLETFKGVQNPKKVRNLISTLFLNISLSFPPFYCWNPLAGCIATLTRQSARLSKKEVGKVLIHLISVRKQGSLVKSCSSFSG